MFLFFCILCRLSYLIEFLVTLWAFVALVRVMDLQVAHFGRGVGESPLAVVTVVRLLATMHQLVALQVTRGGEEFAAVLAAVACLSGVPLPV